MSKPKTPTRWAVKCHSRNESRFMWREYRPILFWTRKEARKWIEENYGYIRMRMDLCSAPHHWRMPRAVPVTVTIKEKTR